MCTNPYSAIYCNISLYNIVITGGEEVKRKNEKEKSRSEEKEEEGKGGVEEGKGVEGEVSEEKLGGEEEVNINLQTQEDEENQKEL